MFKLYFNFVGLCLTYEIKGDAFDICAKSRKLTESVRILQPMLSLVLDGLFAQYAKHSSQARSAPKKAVTIQEIIFALSALKFHMAKPAHIAKLLENSLFKNVRNICV